MITSPHSLDALTPKEEAAPKSPTQEQLEPSSVLSSTKLEGQALHVAVLKQIEWYFSRQNLSTDSFLISQMNSQKYVPITLIANFPKVKNLTDNIEFITKVMKHSKILTVNETETLVRPNWTSERTTLILRDLNVSSIDEIRQIFAADDQTSPLPDTPTNTNDTTKEEDSSSDNKKPQTSSSSTSSTSSTTPTSPTTSSPIKLRFRITNIRADVIATYFVTFQNEDECLKAADFLNSQTFKGKPIRFRVKSENLFRSYFNPGASPTASIPPYPNMPGPGLPNHGITSVPPGGFPVSNIGMGNTVGNVNTGMQSNVSPAAFQHQWGPVPSPLSSNFFFGYMPPVAPAGPSMHPQFPRGVPGVGMAPGVQQPPIIMVMPPQAQAHNQINHNPTTSTSNPNQGRTGSNTTSGSSTDSSSQTGSSSPSRVPVTSSPVSTASRKSLESGDGSVNVPVLNNTRGSNHSTGNSNKDNSSLIGNTNTNKNSDFSSAGSPNRNGNCLRNGNNNSSHNKNATHSQNNRSVNSDETSHTDQPSTGPREQSIAFNRDRQGTSDRRIRRGAAPAVNRNRDMHPRKYKTKFRYGIGSRLQPNFGPEHFPPLPSSGKHYTAKNPHSTFSHSQQTQQQKPKSPVLTSTDDNINIPDISDDNSQNQPTSPDTQSPSYASIATNMSNNIE